jgi:hypothetical protein
VAFDVITPVRLGQGEIATSPSFTTLRTTPVDSVDLVKNIDIANNSTLERIVSIHLVASGDSPSNANIIFPSVTVYANQVVQWSGIQVQDAEGTIQAQADGAGVCVTISGGNGVSSA